MGYTHYFRHKQVLNKENFLKVVEDFKKMMPVFQTLGIELKNYAGDPTKEPEIKPTLIAFNGNEKCGHEERDLGIAWPAKDAHGIGLGYIPAEPVECSTTNTLLTEKGFSSDQIISNGQVPVLTPTGGQMLRANDSDVAGTWFAGCHLKTRTCGGDCSHESFVLPQKFKAEKWQKPENGLFFSFCKTAYKPYDLAVNCALIIAQHHLGDEIAVSSDGDIAQWSDAMQLCQNVVGYGNEFKLSD